MRAGLVGVFSAFLASHLGLTFWECFDIAWIVGLTFGMVEEGWV